MAYEDTPEDRIPNPRQSETTPSEGSREDNSPNSEVAKTDPSRVLPFAFTHPLLQGAKLSNPDERRPGTVVRSMMYQPGEAHFRSALACLRNGWSVYPQTRDDKRRPWLIDGQGILIKTYQEVRPDERLVHYWIEKAPSANVAVIMGPASGGMIGFDIDFDDLDKSSWAQRLAQKHFGLTPFRRQGRAPRMMLFYRVDPGTQIRSRALKVAGSDDAIEILGQGKSVTIYGTHHKTGDYFKWADKAPAFASTDLAPIITQAQLDAFLDDLDHAFELVGYRAKPVSHFSAELVNFDGPVNAPRNRMDSGTWERQGLGKLLVKGRQSWMFARAFEYVRLNTDAVRTDEGSAAVFQRYLFEALRYIARTGDWSTDAAIEKECRSIWSRTRANLLADRIKAQTVTVIEDGSRQVVATGGVLAIAGDLGSASRWVPAPGSKDRRKSPVRVVEKVDADHMPNAERAKAVALLDADSREEIGKRVSAEVEAYIDSFLDLLWDNADRIDALLKEGKALPAELMEIGALIAPTGAGKTSTAMRRFVHKIETRGRLPFALALITPNHRNASEASGIAQAAGAADVWSEIVDATRGARVLHYKGKAEAGCLRADEVRALQSAGIFTAGLCRSQVIHPVTEEKTESFCAFYNDCPSIAQRKLAELADIIFLPHAYITNPLPKEVSARIGAIIIDERFWPELAHTAQLPIGILHKARRPPYLMKADKRDGITAQDHMLGRHRAAMVVEDAVKSGVCPAYALACYEKVEALSKKRVTGLELVQSAKLVCSRAKGGGMEVTPSTTADDIGELLTRPEGEMLMVEWRFWTIVEEIIHAYRQGRKSRDIKTDTRIKILSHSRKIGKGDKAKSVADYALSLGWRITPNFSNRPLFLLDASAHPRILGKIFKGRPVKVHKVEAPLHLRTIVVAENMFDQKMIPSAPGNLNRDDQARAADIQSKLRFMTAHVAAMYPTERVLVGSTLAGVKAMTNEWPSPDNVDFAHFGNLRGLNAYEEHAAAISFGRMELPVDVLDGLVATFSYDDETPEPAWNATGTGWIGKQKLRAPEGERRLMRRDGAYVTLRDSTYDDSIYPWHNIIRAQWREEELRQFAGRLRPVYRKGEAPLWICVSTSVPHDIIVDDVLTLDQIVKGAGLGEAVRRANGLMDVKRIDRDVADREQDRDRICGAMRGTDGRMNEGYAVANIWSDGRPESRKVRIAAWVPNVWDAIYASERKLGRELDRVDVIVEAPKVNPLARIPEPSKIDRAMSRLPNAATATRQEFLQERADAEAIRRERLLERLTEEIRLTDPDGRINIAAIRMEGVAPALPLHVAMILDAYPPPSDEAEEEAPHLAEPEPPPIAQTA
ncbi:MAG: bifunctional DNA primase/polymerase [Beijerinckiaceae bacterium]|nr:bifunctional DNA primase/polymerase [Beijerinckiaceae bacterium]